MSSSLGTLRLDLIAEVGGFTKGLSKAEQRSDKFKKKVSREFRDLQQKAKLAGVAVAGLSVAVLKIATDTLQAQENLGDLAKALGANVTKLGALQYAAENNGSSAENLASGLAVLQKRLGDVATKGSGPAKQALDALGLSLDDIAGKNPTEQFRTIAQAMQGVENQSQRNSIASALFSRANQNLVTTLSLSGDQLDQYEAKAKALGITLSQDQVQAASQADKAIRDLKFSFQGAANTIASDLAPQIESIATDLSTFIQNARDNGTIKAFFSGMVGSVKTLVTHVRELAKWLIVSKAAITGAKLGARYGFKGVALGGATGAAAGFAFFKAVDNFATNAAKANGIALEGLSNLTKLEGKEKTLIDRLDRLKAQRDHDISDDYRQRTLEPNIKKAQDKLQAVEEKLRLERRAQAALRLEPITVSGDPLPPKPPEPPEPPKPPKPPTDAQRAARQLNAEYARTLADLQKQITLYDKTGDTVRLRYELEAGELSKLNPERKAHIKSLADELDALGKQKQAVADLFPEWRKLDQAQKLQTEVKALPPGLQQAGQQAADRLTASTATAGLPGTTRLDPQYGGAFGELARLNDEQSQYQAAYQQRLSSFRAYAQQHQSAKAQSDAAIEALENAHSQRLAQYQSQAQQAQLAGSAQTFGQLAGLTRRFAGEHSRIYQAIFATQKAFSIAKAALAIKDAISSALSLPFPENLAAAAAAGAAALALVGDVSSIAMGGGGAVAAATGGIIVGPGTSTSDSIPARLSNGEAVLNAKAVKSVGAEFIHTLNAGKGYAQGGVVGPRLPRDRRGPNTIVNVQNYTDGTAQTKRHKNSQGQDVVTVMIRKAAADVRSGGELGQAVLFATGSGRKLSG